MNTEGNAALPIHRSTGGRFCFDIVNYYRENWYHISHERIPEEILETASGCRHPSCFCRSRFHSELPEQTGHVFMG